MTTKDKSLEGLRGLAALAVVLAHLLGLLYPELALWSYPTNIELQLRYPWQEIASFPVVGLLYNGSFAVSIFFVLSGYVLTIKFFESGNRDLMRAAAIKRYPRLVIPAFVAVLLAWALLSAGAMGTYLAPEIGGAGWPMSSYKEPAAIWAALWEGAIGVAFTGTSPLDIPLWTIALELKGSIILFLVYGVFGKHRLVLASAMFATLSLFLYPSNSRGLFLLFSMFAGSLLNLCRTALVGQNALGAALIVLGLYVGGFCFYEPMYWPLMNLRLPVLPSPFFDFNEPSTTLLFYRSIGAFALVAGVMAYQPAARVLSSRSPTFLGRISFAMYLIHWPILCSLSYWLMWALQIEFGVEHQLASAIMFAATIAVVLLASNVFERFVDRPAIRISNWLGKERQSALDKMGRLTPSILSTR